MPKTPTRRLTQSLVIHFCHTGEEAGELEDDFDGEDGEEPWEIDKYIAEGYAPP